MSKRIIAVVDDLFFASKIRGTAEQVGSKVVFARTADALLESARSDLPSLIIVDLHSQKVDPIGLATNLKSDEQLRSVRLVGFFSHVEVELQKSAMTAGFDRVLPRSAFVRDLVGLLSVE